MLDTRDFGANNQPSSNPSATGATGSTNSSDPVTASYGNTHSSTGRSNPIHPSDPQSTAHPAYGNSTFSSPYETGGGNTGQGDGEAPSVNQGSDVGKGVGVGKEGALHTGGHGGMGEDYHANIDAAYGHATRREPPKGYQPETGASKGPYDTGGGNPVQAGGQGSTTMSSTQPPASSLSGTTNGGTGTTQAVPDTGYRAQPFTSGNSAAAASTTTGAAEGAGDRSTGATVKEVAHGVKGLFAAIHGAGETARGTFNAGVDHSFNETSGEEKDRAVAAEGKQEMTTGMFSDRTKEREGTITGDSDLRRNRGL